VSWFTLLGYLLLYAFCVSLLFTYLSFFRVFFNDTAPTEIYTLSLHDALPIWTLFALVALVPRHPYSAAISRFLSWSFGTDGPLRSEEHTSELQSLAYLVCRLLLEKKKKKKIYVLLVTQHHTRTLPCHVINIYL